MTFALTGSTSAAKWPTKSSSGSRPTPCWSTMRFASAGAGGASPPRGGDRLASSSPEPGEVDQPDDVARVGAERGDDLLAVGMPHDDGRSIEPGEDLAQPHEVVGEGRQRKLWGGDLLALGLQVLYDGAPARSVGKGTVDQNDIRLVGHFQLLD
jgi:hypothetical protein